MFCVYATKFTSALSFEPNLLSPDAFYNLKMHQNAFAAMALPQTQMGELTVLPTDPLAGIKRPLHSGRRERKEMEWGREGM